MDLHGEVQVFSFFSLGGIIAVQFICVKKEILIFQERRYNEFQECVWILIHLSKGCSIVAPVSQVQQDGLQMGVC